MALTATGGYFLYQQRPAGLPPGFASGNGRLEATEVDVATKIAGRLSELGPREGDMVEAGAVVARFDADDLRAQLRAAEAQVAQAQVAQAQNLEEVNFVASKSDRIHCRIPRGAEDCSAR